jgi:hypothetical protein
LVAELIYSFNDSFVNYAKDKEEEFQMKSRINRHIMSMMLLITCYILHIQIANSYSNNLSIF